MQVSATASEVQSSEVQPAPAEASPRRAGVPARLAVLLLLAFLTCGFLLFDRGFFQDDTMALYSARAVQDQPWQHRLHPRGEGPTRLLSLVTYSLALETPSPVRTLQWMLLACWVGTALLAGALARRLLPSVAAAGTCAALLVATASSDFLTGSVVALGYQLAIAAFLAAFIAAFDYTRRGGIWRIVAATAALLFSLWTVDVAALTYPLVPLYLFLGASREQRRRALILAATWLLTSLPYVFAFASFLRGDYAQVAIMRPQGSVLPAVVEQLAHNFMPWRWGPFRKPWFAPPEPVLPAALMVSLAAVGALLALWVWHRDRRQAPLGQHAAAGTVQTAVTLAVLLAVANVPSTLLQMSAIHYRTHLLSRVWASLLVTLGAGLLLRRGGRAPRVAAYALVGTFVLGGVWGGLERQAYYFSTWLDHRREVASIVAASPRLRPDTQLLMVVPPHQRYLAMEAWYLSVVWAGLLYDDPAVADRITHVSPARGTGCRVEAAGLRCWAEGHAACAPTGPCDGRLLPNRQVLMLEEEPDGTVERPAALPDFFLNDERAADLGSAAPMPATPALEEIRRRLLIEPTTPWAKYLARRRPVPAAAADGRPAEVHGGVDRCSVGGVAVTAVKSGAEVTVEGWALAGHASPAAVMLTVDGRLVAATAAFFDRPDVAAALHETAAAGWRLTLPTAGLAAGKHVVAVTVLPQLGSELVSLPPSEITILPAAL